MTARVRFALVALILGGIAVSLAAQGTKGAPPGMPRRIFDYKQHAHLGDLQGMNIFMTWSTFVLLAGQLVFMVNFFYSFGFGRRAESNPWRANTLEWTVDRPGHGNLEVIPAVYRGPYEYSVPGAANDYLLQSQPPAEDAGSAGGPGSPSPA